MQLQKHMHVVYDLQNSSEKCVFICTWKKEENVLFLQIKKGITGRKRTNWTFLNKEQRKADSSGWKVGSELAPNGSWYRLCSGLQTFGQHRNRCARLPDQDDWNNWKWINQFLRIMAIIMKIWHLNLYISDADSLSRVCKMGKIAAIIFNTVLCSQKKIKAHLQAKVSILQTWTNS